MKATAIVENQVLELYRKLLEEKDIEIERLNKEVEKYKKRCLTGLRLIRDNYGVLDKYGLDILDDILNGADKE